MYSKNQEKKPIDLRPFPTRPSRPSPHDCLGMGSFRLLAHLFRLYTKRTLILSFSFVDFGKDDIENLGDCIQTQEFGREIGSHQNADLLFCERPADVDEPGICTKSSDRRRNPGCKEEMDTQNNVNLPKPWQYSIYFLDTSKKPLDIASMIVPCVSFPQLFILHGPTDCLKDCDLTSFTLPLSSQHEKILSHIACVPSIVSTIRLKSPLGKGLGACQLQKRIVNPSHQMVCRVDSSTQGCSIRKFQAQQLGPAPLEDTILATATWQVGLRSPNKLAEPPVADVTSIHFVSVTSKQRGVQSQCENPRPTTVFFWLPTCPKVFFARQSTFCGQSQNWTPSAFTSPRSTRRVKLLEGTTID